METQLRYLEEAAEWLEALPLGNGSFGQMVYGGIRSEKVTLNEESFWAGYPRDNHRPEAYQNLEKVRKYISQGECVKAQEITEHKMLSRFNQPYQPLGTLYLTFSGIGSASDYERVLDMETGIIRVKYKTENTQYVREYFCSYPDQAMAVKISAKGSGTLDFEITLDSPCKYTAEASSSEEIYMEAVAPSEVIVKDVYKFPEDSEVKYGKEDTIHGHLMLRVIQNEGESVISGKGIRVSGCSECILYLTGTTSYKVVDGKRWCDEHLKSAIRQGYEHVRDRHVRDFSALSRRVSLRLNNKGLSQESELAGDGESLSNIPDTLVLLHDSGKADRVTELLFQYGRYLLISSSREGGLPANLQGIWNDKCIPPWWSNWTMNINLEMNYWPAYRCNLAECAKPLLDFIGRTADNGEQTARIHYGCRGWTSHHMMDIWMNTTPVGDSGRAEKDSASWALWNLSGVWLCLHLWEAYQYTSDLVFLKDYAYPIMKGSAEFILDWLVLENGVYQTMPSISPENIYLTKEGDRCAVCKSSAMDIELIGELLDCVGRAGTLLGEEAGFIERLKHTLSRLAPVKIGTEGQILEWGENRTEEDPGHRHFSHLFGLYPGHQFTARKNKELWDGSKVSLETRMANGGGSTGWSRAWAICLWARLGCGQQAYESVIKFQKEDIFDNFMGYCPPKYFQIDCNFGYTAAIAEMLLQTEDGGIIPIPALPDEWGSGEVRGLVCEGGSTADIVWADKKVVRITIKAGYTGMCHVKIAGRISVASGTDSIGYRVLEEWVEFEQMRGRIYEINVYRD